MTVVRTALALAMLHLAGCRARSSEGTVGPARARGEASASTPLASTEAPAVSAEPSASAAPSVEVPCEDLVAGGPPLPSFPRGFTHKGIDASTDVAWATARQHGITFAILQTTLGGKPNAAFAKNWAMARACGIKRGAYHFMSPRADAESQADLFVERAGDLGELPPIVDVELVPGCKGPCCELSCDDWKSATARVLARVEKRSGIRPLVYTVEPFWKECLCNTSRFAEHALWLAGYPRFDAAPRPGFGGWQRWTFYQAAGNVRLGRGVVDTDVFAGDDRAFEALLQTMRR